MFRKKFSKKDFEEFIKFKKFDEHAFYIVTVGNDKYEPTLEVINQIGDTLQKTFPDMKFIIVPNYIKIVGFEPIKSTNSK